MFATLLQTTDQAMVEKAVMLYRERYDEIGVYETEPYVGIQTMLSEIKAAKATRMFVATSKPTVFAMRIVQHLKFGEFFEEIYGPDLDGRLDEKAELLHHLLNRENISPESAVMIGDRAADVIAAKANGIRSVGIRWGYGSEEELRAAGSDELCSTPSALLLHINRFADQAER
jgi:phosphoglycolate phosphatase